MSKGDAIQNGDSTMRLERVRGSMRCCEPDCGRQGRYRMRILGTYIESASLVNRYSLLCTPCAKAARGLWDELAGRVEAVGERREQAVRVLRAAAQSSDNAALAARADAIDTLLSLGHSRSQVLKARDHARDGDSVEEIVSSLLGGDRVEAVAA